MTDDDLIPVSRSDLEAVLNPRCATAVLMPAVKRLRAALTPPKPPWEPSETRDAVIEGSARDASRTGPSECDEDCPGCISASYADEPPWSPSEADIDAYCEAAGLFIQAGRGWARGLLIMAREWGFNAVPRRLTPTVLTDEQWNEFWRTVGIGNFGFEPLRAAGWTIEPPS